MLAASRARGRLILQRTIMGTVPSASNPPSRDTVKESQRLLETILRKQKDQPEALQAWRELERLGITDAEAAACAYLSQHPGLDGRTDEQAESLLVSRDDMKELSLEERYYAYQQAQRQYWQDPRHVGMLKGCPFREESFELFKEQFQLEVSTVDEVRRDFESWVESAAVFKLSSRMSASNRIIVNWFPAMTEAIRKHVTGIAIRDAGVVTHGYGDYLSQLDAEELAVITLSQLLTFVMTTAHGCKTVAVAVAIGEAVEAQTQLYALRRRFGNQVLGKAPSQREIGRKHKQLIGSSSWDVSAHVMVGCALIKLAIETCEITVDGMPITAEARKKMPKEELRDLSPAFMHLVDFEQVGRHESKMRKIGYIRAHEHLIEAVRSTTSLQRDAADGRWLPMLVRPLPWTAEPLWDSPFKGVYLFHRSTLMRLRRSIKQKEALLSSLNNSEGLRALRGLNVLNSTRWRVNRKILRVVDEVRGLGGNMAALVQGSDYPEIPRPVTLDREVLRKWLRENKKIKQRNKDLHSLRSDLMLKLNIARDLADRDFYFPHNLDFRGRSYPIPPHFNHLGADLSRGMLQFSEKKPLGERGLFWLKIQLANLHGADKLNFDERIQFADEHLGEVQDSANDPLGGRRWWMQADDPWQCLACCFEIAEALKCSNPAEFMSNLPVHQDGSCNGLQHYAALGGDVAGAEQVNLVPSEKPGDVYSAVAAIVARRVEEDAAAGDEAAQMLVGRIKRKLVKQTVMTSVYGVTYVGARAQIESQMASPEFPEDERFRLSTYVTALTFDALEEMFTNAKLIMAWLADCAGVVGRNGNAVEWTTPLGLQIVQPYRQARKHSVNTVLQSITVELENDDLPVNKQRQRSAFPPNFVHSLDSTHMLMTAEECARAGVTYASVHDSYWTHACSVDQMSSILREQFIQLHTQPLLENLLRELKERNPQVASEFKPVPSRGDLDLNVIRGSLYFFD